MPAGPNTKANVGIRRFIYSTTPPGYRNFEPNGTQTYTVVASHGYSHAGTSYTKGQTIAYDAAGGTKYGNINRLERDFNRGALDPSN
jgi:hypothetical protein